MVVTIPFLSARITSERDFLMLKEMVNNQEQWSLDYDRTDIKIWSKVVRHASIKMVKVWSNFPAVNSRDLYNTIMDSTYRAHWDPHMKLGYEIGHLNCNNVVTYYAVSCPPPLRSRDFVLQTSWLDNDSELFVINHSVCHKDHPPKKGYIRAISFFTGYLIKCLPHNSCEMSFVSQIDPQGMVPTWIVNKCTQIFVPRFIKQLEKAAFSYNAWKSQNNPNYIPWMFPEQMKSPKISIADCRPSHEEQESSFFKYLATSNINMERWSCEVKVNSSSLPTSSPALMVPKSRSKISTTHLGAGPHQVSKEKSDNHQAVVQRKKTAKKN